MKVLLVSSGLPPRGRWGTERYTRQLAAGLVRRGHAVSVLVPSSSGTRPPYDVQRVESEGVDLYLMERPAHRKKRFQSSYLDPGIDTALRDLLSELQPDLVHFLYLLWQFSLGMAVACRAQGVPALMTATDFGLFCHRGQMHDWRLADCGGPRSAEVCARCIREPSPFDDTPRRLRLKRMAVRTAYWAGGLGGVVRTADVARREAAVKQALNALHHVIAPSSMMERVFTRAGFSPKRLSRLVYAFDERPFLAARAEPPARPVRIGFLGQFAPHKAPGTLLQAVEIMRHRLPESVEPWEVIFYGEGTGARHALYPAHAFRGAFDDDGLPPRVRIVPPRDDFDLPAVLAGLHCVVVPSEWSENAPLVALEARAAGVWVVASDVPGIRDVIESGVHGEFFPPGDVQRLADILREVVLGRRARSAQPGLPVSYGVHLDRIESIYRAVADPTAQDLDAARDGARDAGGNVTRLEASG